MLREAGTSHEVFVHSNSGFAAFGNGPHDERLAAAHVSRGEDAGDRAHVVRAGGDVAARVKIHAKLLDHSLFYRTEKTEREKHEIETAKRQYGRAAADTAKQVRQGSINQRDIRSNVDFKAALRAKDRPSPLFAVFANAVADNLKRTINSDADAEKLATIERVLPQISMLEDWESLRRLDVELVNLGERASRWRGRLTPSREKVVQFRALEKKGA